MATSILPGTTRSGGHARTYKLGAGLRMRGATSGRVGILPPATITDYDLTLPVALGASDKLLQVSSAGVVSLVDPVTIGGTGTELLYRGGASSATAVAGSSWDGTTLTVPKTTRWFPRSDQPNFYMTIGYEYDSDDAIRFFARTYRFIGGYYDAQEIWLGEKTNNKLVTLSAGKTYFGNGITSATPSPGYLYGTGGSGTNVVGGSLYIAPGPSTGNATPSSIILQSTVAGTSGSTAQTLAYTLTVTNNLVRLAATTYQYWGSEGADGSWRIGRSGNDIVIERRESGVWVTKSTITA